MAHEDGEQHARDPLTRTERRRLGQILGFTELMTALMVAATIFTGIATWRMANIANWIYLASQRPYLGVESVRLDTSKPNEPRVAIEYRNFGQLSSDNTVLDTRMIIDGAVVTGETMRLGAGILSPEVPHLILRPLPPDKYAAIVNGRSKLEVDVKATYRGFDRGQLCYFERFRYLVDAARFEVHGGTSRCDEQPAWAEIQAQSALRPHP
jgi:hypothetical protein